MTSITRQMPSSSPTNSSILTWRVTFDEAVQNMNEADFGVSLVRGSTSRDYSLGWHFTPAKSTIGISFGVRANRRESEGADPEHAVGVEASVRW